MRLALLADIHSNYAALKACLDVIDSGFIDGIVFLGDYVSDCPYPQRTIELIKNRTKKYKTWFIRGNREDYLIYHHHYQNDGWKYSSNSGSLLYTYENLTAEDIEFFEKLPISMTIHMDEFPPITVCHGSPSNSRECLYAHTEAADNYLKDLDTNYLFCAHTHKPFKYAAFGKALINCASVGAPTNGQTDAQFIVIEYQNGVWNDELIRVPYDINKMVQAFEDSGLNEKAFMWARAMIKLLQTGENYPQKCIELAIKKAKQQDENINVVDLPETYWLQAAKELKIIE